MNAIAYRYKSVVTLTALLMAATPMIFTGCGGGMIVPANTLQQGSSPVILSVSPDSGPQAGGIKVIITGSNFTVATQQDPPTIAFGGVQATQVRVVSPTEVVAMTPPHAVGPVAVEVTNSAGKSSSSTNDFTYTKTSLAVSSVSPNSGPTTGGTAVNVAGSGFASGATVSFGGTVGTSISVLSGTQITATAPAHAAGAVTVTVANPDGSQGSLPNGFTYTTSSTVKVGSVTPNSGPTSGGTAVTVTGSGFASGATVSFGGTAASGVSVLSATQVRATTPAHAATGAVTVTVANPDGSHGSLPGGFTYTTSSTVKVDSVTPNSGPTSGGTTVTVTGSGFASGATVSFGGTTGTSISVLSATQVRATTPAHAATGAVTVTVANPDGSHGSLSAGFTYGSTDLTVASVSPTSGPAAGGTQVTITGTNFQSGASVTFGGLAAGSVTVSNSTTILADTPSHSSGSVSITVTNTDGTSATLATGYTFHSVDLNWSAPASSPVTVSGYNVYRAPASSGPYVNLNGSNPVTGTSYSDTTVQGATTYYYEVKSVDSNGVESPPAGPVQVTTSP